MDYERRVHAVKKNYPFDRWFDNGLEQYTRANCDAARRIFDDLLSKLVGFGESAPARDKIACFKAAVEALNQLNDKTEIIETGEREELCELIDDIGRAVGLNPEDYGGGEGIASEWREW